MVTREALNALSEKLKEAGVENALFEANLLLRDTLKLSALDLVLAYQKKISQGDEERLLSALKRRLDGEPMQYILGTQEFMGLEFKVTPDVLIPRADTETLVEAVLLENHGMNVLDLCTGSGCIAVSIAHYNKNAYVHGIDISEAALRIAEENAEKNKVSDRVRFSRMDILSELPAGVYDVIVSNPPYIERDVIPTLQKEVVGFEPHLALDGGTDGLDFYRRIAEIAPKLLQQSGIIYLEVGHTQAEAVEKLLSDVGLKTDVIPDLCGIDRVVAGRKQKV